MINQVEHERCQVKPKIVQEPCGGNTSPRVLFSFTRLVDVRLSEPRRALEGRPWSCERPWWPRDKPVLCARRAPDPHAVILRVLKVSSQSLHVLAVFTEGRGLFFKIYPWRWTIPLLLLLPRFTGLPSPSGGGADFLSSSRSQMALLDSAGASKYQAGGCPFVLFLL